MRWEFVDGPCRGCGKVPVKITDSGEVVEVPPIRWLCGLCPRCRCRRRALVEALELALDQVERVHDELATERANGLLWSRTDREFVRRAARTMMRLLDGDTAFASVKWTTRARKRRQNRLRLTA